MPFLLQMRLLFLAYGFLTMPVERRKKRRKNHDRLEMKHVG